jgi:hypothetical protein
VCRIQKNKACLKGSLNELELSCREAKHSQEKRSVPPPPDIRLSIGTLLIPDGHVGDPEIQSAGAEQKVEITKRVE